MLQGRRFALSQSSSSSDGRSSIAKIEVLSSASSSSTNTSARTSSFDGRDEWRRNSNIYVNSTNNDFQNLALDDPSVTKTLVKTYGTSGKTIFASCNYIRLDYSSECERSIIEYEVIFKPNVDSTRERFYLTNKFFKDLGGKVKVYDGGFNMFTPEKLPDEVNVTSIQLRSGMEVEICIKFARIKKLEDCAYVLNTIFKRIMGSLEFVRFKRADYNPKAAICVPQHHLKIWPGFVTNVSEFEKGIMLCVDTSFRVLRTQTCLDLLYDILNTGGSKSFDCKDEISETFIGTSIITNYNQKNIYRVDDVDFNSSPRSTFETKVGRKISYLEYYKTQYNVTIQDEGQPMFVHRVRRKEMGKEKTDELIYLVPELCSPTGLTDSLKSDFKLMKDIGEFTRPSPAERQAALSNLVESIKNSEKARQYLTDWNLKLPDTTIDLAARVLEPPTLFFGAKKTVCEENADWSRTASCSRVLTSVRFDRWGVIYTRRNERILDNFLDCFSDVARRVGIETCRPQLFALNDDNTKSYCDELKKLARKGPQIMVILFPSIREDRYKAVKKLCNTELGIVTQVVNSRTISRPNALRSVVTKIVLQMNVKIGGALWGVSLPYAEEGIMIGGIDIYHDAASRNHSVIALVASTNSSCTQWTSATAEHNRAQTISDVLLPLLMQCLESWKQKNRLYPSRIILYRHGVNDGQLNVFRDFEVPQFENVFKKINPEYHPKFTYIAVLRQTGTRLYQKARNQFSNPPPGCVVDHDITKRDLNEFYLVSQHATRGTVSPTRFIIITNSELSINSIQDISYKTMCLYYNWSGAVNIPAPCMYARKLATLVGEHMHGPATKNLRDSPFFL